MVKLADEFGAVLAGRGLAEQIREAIEADIKRGRLVIVDFNGVEAMSPSFADELFGKLVAAVGEDAVRFENVSRSLKPVARMARETRNGPQSGSG